MLESSLETRLLPDDVMAAILLDLPSDDLPADPVIIHSAVKQLKGEFPALFQDYVFSESKTTAFSKLLERVLFRLECSGIISGLNPTYAQYKINKSKKERVFKIINANAAPHELEMLREATKKFYSLVVH